jgi:GDP-4-dehydro-6-deoxy-D-mannose reductase
MRFFVTGISGFVGTHLVDRLLAEGHDVTGVALEGWTNGLDSFRARGLDPAAVAALDVRDVTGLRRAIAAARPEGIFHLAGLAFVPRAQADPRLAYEVNLFGTIALLEAVRAEVPTARTVVVTSGEVYGRQERPGPIDETAPLRPVSPYGASKAAADLAALQAHLGHGLDVVRARPFNHTGPGQSPIFVCAEFAAAIAAAERLSGPTRLRVGNLDSERDFSDVRDVVRGYLALFERGRAGAAYNVASGRATSVRAVLDALRAASPARIEIEVDPAKIRASEVPRIVASIASIGGDTGWRPEIPFEQTLADLLAFARASPARKGANSIAG